MLESLPLILAQADPTTAAPLAPLAAAKPWWQLIVENSLALTITFIFLTAILSVVLTQRRRDKCLKLLHDFHVTYLTTAGVPVWGDLIVYSSGIELTFDAPHRTRRGLPKSSAMVYQKDMASTLAICRVDYGLTETERRQRDAQVRRTFRPNIFRRAMRWFRNLLATLKDAFSQALNAMIGALLKTRAPTTLAEQEARVQQIGQTVLGATANAYEPILEAHIGKPVVLKLQGPAEPTNKANEIAGYLVDYNDAYVAVFNVDHTPEERIELELSESMERPNLRVELLESDVTVSNPGPDVIVVKSMSVGETDPGGTGEAMGSGVSKACDDRFCELAVPLLVGCRLTIRRTPGRPVKLVLERTMRLDIVAPRSLATVNFAAETELPRDRRWFGLAPEHEAEQDTGVAERERPWPKRLFR